MIAAKCLEANSIAALCSSTQDFKEWLEETGASKVTANSYATAVDRWLQELRSTPTTVPCLAWVRSDQSSSMKRLTGYAVRRFVSFHKLVYHEEVDLGVPARLPRASRPSPRDLGNNVIRDLCLAAKRLFPEETGLTVRVWIQFLAESGVRRSESEIEWTDIDWIKKSVVISGKTGTRELPLSKKMTRRFAFLIRRGRSGPWIGSRSQAVSGGTLYNLFKRCAAEIGLPDLRPHHLRHLRLTKICRSKLGQNQLAVLSFAGVSNLSTLSYYYAVNLEEKRQLLG